MGEAQKDLCCGVPFAGKGIIWLLGVRSSIYTCAQMAVCKHFPFPTPNPTSNSGKVGAFGNQCFSSDIQMTQLLPHSSPVTSLLIGHEFVRKKGIILNHLPRKVTWCKANYGQ